ncbi:MAG: ankyrin repeat domain-containing protein [candidate division Zixibacteria bacterium]
MRITVFLITVILFICFSAAMAETTTNDILEASRSGDLELVQTTLDRDTTTIGIRNDRGSTALHFAAENGHLQIVELLLDRGADLEAIDVDGDTPLMGAAIRGHSEIFKMLLSRGADVDILNINENGVLHYAAMGGSVEIVDLLLDRGQNINTQVAQNQGGFTPLIMAVFRNKQEVVKFLLEKGADIEISDSYGRTPLSIAVQENKQELVKFLLDKGADIENLDCYAYTPLYLARATGNVDMVQLLLDNGANENKPVGMTARALNNENFNWKSKSSKHFRTYYLPGSVAERDIETLIKKNEAYLASHLALLGVEEYDKVIDFFYCDSQDQVKEISSYPDRAISSHVSKTILVTLNSEVNGHDSHEIMHIISLDVWGGWEWNHPTSQAWLSEGLATYADIPCNGYKPAELAAHILKNTEDSVPLDSLAIDFSQYPEMIGNILMASFVQFILDQYGMEHFHHLWMDRYEGFEDVFGKDVATVEQEWHKYMDTKYPNPQVPDWPDLTEHGCK